MRKGLGEAFFVGIIAVVFIIANVFLFALIHLNSGQTQNLYFFSIETNEEGKELKSMLNTNYGDRFMNVFGDVVTEGGLERLQQNQGHVENALQSLGKSCIVIFNEFPEDYVVRIGTCPAKIDKYNSAMLPVPGAKVDRKLRILII